MQTSPGSAASIANYAVTEDQSRGRDFAEAPPAYRSQFQRDRDRIIHSSAFRRLEYKTQVFVNHEGDMFRTRLTHSLEVAQIARVIARALRLNEDLTETIALAHDLGHTPFGHAGQSSLNNCMEAFGGFEHNFQSLRVVQELEARYPNFAGLNLLYESREGILKHCSVERARELGPLGQRFIDGTQASLEAQLANIADEIAYNHHDIDDGLRAELLTLDQMMEFPLFRERYEQARARYQQAGTKLIVHSVIREMVNYFVSDLIAATHASLAQEPPRDVAEVRARTNSLVNFSAQGREHHLSLKRLLRVELYNHPRVRANADNAAIVVSRLFDAFFRHPDRLPLEQRRDIDIKNADTRAQLVADYVAGMTDRFAIGEHQRLFGHRQFDAN